MVAIRPEALRSLYRKGSSIVAAGQLVPDAVVQLVKDIGRD